MRKATPSVHPDYTPLEEAIDTVKTLADYINEHQRDADNAVQLADIQSKIDKYPGTLAQSKRTLTKDGPILANKEKSHMWLFSDIAVFTKAEKKGRYKFVQQLNLKTSSFQDDEGTKFRLLSTEGLQSCQVSTPQEKEDWKKVIQANLDEAREQLLKSAFTDDIAAGSEGSKKYREFQSAEFRKKQQDAIQHLIETETEYIAFLSNMNTAFLQPMRDLAGGTGPVTADPVSAVCSNTEPLLAEHKRFLEDVSQRYKEWNEKSVISDIFDKHHGEQVAAVEKCLLNDQYFMAIRNKEIEQKSDLKFLLERPLRRISEYYLFVQVKRVSGILSQKKEMVQYIDKSHDDYEALSKLNALLRATTEEFAKRVAEQRPASSGARNSPTVRQTGTLKKSKVNKRVAKP